MSPRDRDPTALALRLFLIASAVTAVAALRVAVERAGAAPAAAAPPATVPLVVAPAEPIRAEAQVFRTTPAMLALEPATLREREAHPRRLATVHFLRGFPGAPPRIPHPLTPDEFRTNGCKTCHERGGYSKRFKAYVPLTPHPERGICLQCHVGVDSVMGLEPPNPDPNTRCHLCHGVGGGRPQAAASATWATTVWPKLPPISPDSSPPVIPHDLAYRQNCVTCHAGPAAVSEIRTNHPEWANCRQCHVVLDPAAGVFTRPAKDSTTGTGGAT